MIVDTVEVARSIVSLCKAKYDNRFEFFYTGGYARNERNITDYDIAIYDNDNNTDDWEDVLKVFHNKKEHDDIPIDAQIDQMFKVVSKMNGNTIYENRDEKVYRYVYSDKYLTDIRHKDIKWVKYLNVYNNLWRKEVFLVSHKHRNMGLDKLRRVSKVI